MFAIVDVGTGHIPSADLSSFVQQRFVLDLEPTELTILPADSSFVLGTVATSPFRGRRAISRNPPDERPDENTPTGALLSSGRCTPVLPDSHTGSFRVGDVAEYLLNNRLQMRYVSATGSFVTLTKQMKIGLCEQVRVN